MERTSQEPDEMTLIKKVGQTEPDQTTLTQRVSCVEQTYEPWILDGLLFRQTLTGQRRLVLYKTVVLSNLTREDCLLATQKKGTCRLDHLPSHLALFFSICLQTALTKWLQLNKILPAPTSSFYGFISWKGSSKSIALY